jgi:hypothetical protein
MRQAAKALLASAFAVTTSFGAAAQTNDVISYVNFTWYDFSQATCLERGADAINAAIDAFGIEDATTRVEDWSVLANTPDLNFWVFCIADHDDLVDPAAQRVLALSSVNSGRADIGGELRDFLATCMDGACPATGGDRIAWTTRPNESQFDGPEGTQYDLVCPPLGDASMGFIWGTDIYTDDSPICVAAVHAGVISTNGGNVIIEIAPGQKAYLASDRNGVSSSEWGAYDRSYRFIDAVG